MENQPTNQPVVIVQTSGQQTPPESSNSSEPGPSERNESVQFGQVLEAHRNLAERTQAQEARLEALEARTGEIQTGQSAIMARLDEALRAREAEVEIEEEVTEIVPERAEEETPEPEPVKPRNPLIKAIFG